MIAFPAWAPPPWSIPYWILGAKIGSPTHDRTFKRPLTKCNNPTVVAIYPPCSSRKTADNKYSWLWMIYSLIIFPCQNSNECREPVLLTPGKGIHFYRERRAVHLFQGDLLFATHGPWSSLSNGISTHLFGFDETISQRPLSVWLRMMPLPNRYMFQYFAIERTPRECKIELLWTRTYRVGILQS
jgi:hypothetical protein